MSSTRTMGISVTDVDTEAKLPLGFKYVQPAGTSDDDGEKIWIYVKADGTALAVGEIAVRDPSALTNDLYGVIPSASGGTPLVAMSVVGVAQHAIASNSFGFIQAKGKALVKNGTANIAADTGITSGGDRVGAAIDVAGATDDAVFGFSLEAEAGNNTTFDAYINCPGA